MRLCLEKRFDPINRTLTLESFYQTPELITDYYLPLLRPIVCAKIFSIIDPFMATLQGLDLSGNRLTSLDGFSILPTKAVSLKYLSLKQNLVSQINTKKVSKY